MNPFDQIKYQHSYHDLARQCSPTTESPAARNPLFCEVQPHYFDSPKLVARSNDCLSLLDLPPSETTTDHLLDFFARPARQPFKPLAQKYTGHQFGVYNPQLGDGRGLLLAEAVSSNGKFDLHLKGAGQTPYSRMGDGRAVLRSCIREFLASEALHHLGIPTSRALCVIGSNEQVQRETAESAAMLVRVTPTHIRFGHFEYLFHSKQHELLNILIDYSIKQLYPHLLDDQQPVLAFFQEITRRTAIMIANWQANGFCHGVMNTDNFSIIGETFDFGPYGFLDNFDPGHICNHSDWDGRYAFNQQPEIGLWNLNCLAHSFSSHLSREQLVETLKSYEVHFHGTYSQLLRNKFGLQETQPGDDELMGQFLSMLASQEADYTRAFRQLSNLSIHEETHLAANEFKDRDAFYRWAADYRARLARETCQESARQESMQQSNPKFILRNYLAQNAIQSAEQGNYEPLSKLASVLRKPFDEQPENEEFAALPPDWGKTLEISCSS